MTRTARLGALLALSVVTAGCAAQAGAPAAVPRPAAMSMPAAGAAAAPPPDTATMVCGAEIKGAVRQVLALPAEPATSATWADSVYTCTYALPVGPMTLSVRVLPDAARAGATLDADRARSAGAEPLYGLGERAWGTQSGTAVVLKDNQILTVDTTRLPEVFGANDQKRTDLAYEIASDVLGCWTGDE